MHKNPGFGKSKALQQGTVTNVTRARVTELLSLDPDQPASPSQRVSCHYYDNDNILGLNMFWTSNQPAILNGCKP